MFCFIDMVCDDCFFIWEHDKGSILNDSPNGTICPNCGSNNTRRSFKGTIATEVQEGKCGNAKTTYTTSMVSHGSTFTNNARRTKIKK